MINRDQFFTRARPTVFHGWMNQSQVNGCNSILDGWEKQLSAGDVRWLAYMLATAFHETAATMQPIEEYGLGRGRAYGTPTGPWHQVYFGRGDVQLTWEANYAKATTELQKLGVLTAEQNMVENPALALDPDIAFAVMLYGMRDGWFTGKCLADYFTPHITDFLNAREIINGKDCEAQIAAYARNFLAALT